VFTQHILTQDPDGAGPEQGYADGARTTAISDLDGDGDLDIVWGARLNHTIGWFENMAVDVPGRCTSDLDGDGHVGVTDLLLLLKAWATTPPGPPDLDGDGTVGTSDLLALLAGWGPCDEGDNCGLPDAGSCFEIHATPGCQDIACCLQVCPVDPSCCDLAWDAACRYLALELCAGCGLPESGSCCSAHASPGCHNPFCCQDVCEADLFCCEVAWDGDCALLAVGICGCPPPP
jgi:hypothetical protein